MKGKLTFDGGETYLYSAAVLTLTSSIVIEQKARAKAVARRALVISGILKSTAARRMR